MVAQSKRLKIRPLLPALEKSGNFSAGGDFLRVDQGGLGRFLKHVGVKSSLEIAFLLNLIFWGRSLAPHLMYNTE